MVTAFVTGFTGFIALHITKILLERGYTVIGSARSQAKGDEYAKIINNANFKFVVIEEISSEGAFDQAFIDHKDIEYVFHAASPVIFNPKDGRKDMFEPALAGVLNLFNGAKKYGDNVKKVIHTSSYSAHNAPYDHYGKHDGVVTEDMFSSLDVDTIKDKASYDFYWASKKYGELAIWEFKKKENPHFDIATFSPTWSFGPQAYDEVAKKGPVSILAVISGVLALKPDDEIVSQPGVTVDVRDVALGHVKAAEHPGSDGHRFLLGEDRFDTDTLIEIISRNYKQFDLPKAEIKPVPCPLVDCSKTVQFLDLKLIPLEKSVIDAVDQMLRVGTAAP